MREKATVSGKLDEKLYAERLRDRYRGLIQGYQRVRECPPVVEENYILKLKGKQKWPLDETVKTLHTLHKEDMADDPTVTRDRPGPKFLDKWSQQMKAVEEAAVDGSTRPKQIGQKNRKQLETLITNSGSILIKLALMHVISDERIGDKEYKRIQEIAVMLEKQTEGLNLEKFLPEIKAMFGVKAPTTPLATITEAANQVKTKEEEITSADEQDAAQQPAIEKALEATV